MFLSVGRQNRLISPDERDLLLADDIERRRNPLEEAAVEVERLRVGIGVAGDDGVRESFVVDAVSSEIDVVGARRNIVPADINSLIYGLL